MEIDFTKEEACLLEETAKFYHLTGEELVRRVALERIRAMHKELLLNEYLELREAGKLVELSPKEFRRRLETEDDE